MSHEKDICHGSAIVPYAPYTCAPTLEWPPHINLSPGWVLPGGRRTQDYLQAQSAAKWMDQYTP